MSGGGKTRGFVSSCEMRMPDLREVNAMEKRCEVVRPDPYEFGYGPKAMMEAKVCNHCGNTETADKYTCSKCKKRLPTQTIYQIYQQKHKKCKLCDTILASYMRYCPHCGTQIK